MSDILDQSEVDALLAAVESGVFNESAPATSSYETPRNTPLQDQVEARHYDFKRPERVSKDQMRSLEEHCDYLLGRNVTPLGIGVDSPYSNKAWAAHLGIQRLRLLSDFWPHGEVAKAFGIFREKDGFSERANFILDEQQKVIFAKVYPIGQLPEIHEIIDFLKS